MKLLSFNEFLMEKNLIEEDKSLKRVCIFPGRFMPPHLGHVGAWKRTADALKCKVIPIQIISKNKKSPFPDSLLKRIGKSIEKEYSNFIEEYLIYPEGLITFIPEMIKLLREKGYEPIGVGCGSDRYQDYQRQVEKYVTAPDSEIQIPQFQVAMVDERIEGGPSGTKVRESIQEDDEAKFKELTPKSIHTFYREFKKYI